MRGEPERARCGARQLLVRARALGVHRASVCLSFLCVQTLMFVQVSPVKADSSESICSLRFAERVRKVECQCNRADSRRQPRMQAGAELVLTSVVASCLFLCVCSGQSRGRQEEVKIDGREIRRTWTVEKGLCALRWRLPVDFVSRLLLLSCTPLLRRVVGFQFSAQSHYTREYKLSARIQTNHRLRERAKSAHRSSPVSAAANTASPGHGMDEFSYSLA